MLKHKTFLFYLVGLVLCVLITLFAYAIVTHHSMTDVAMYWWLTILLIAQVIVQAVCFLRLNTSTDDGKLDMVSLGFTVIVIAILVIGSFWIMHNLNYYMVH